MSTAALVTVTVISRCRVLGEPVEPGARLVLPPLEAAGLIDAGRAALLDPADAEALCRARAAEFERAATTANVLGQTPQAAEQQLRELERAARPRGIGFILDDGSTVVQAGQ